MYVSNLYVLYSHSLLATKNLSSNYSRVAFHSLNTVA